MLIHKNKKIIAIVVLIIILVSGCIMGLSAAGVLDEISDKISNVFGENKNSGVDVNKLHVKQGKKEIDTSGVVLDENISRKIKDSDSKGAKKNIDNIKKEIAALLIDGKRLEKVYQLIDNGSKVSDVLTAFRFLNEQYGRLSDMDILLSKKNEGNSWDNIFAEYLAQNNEFTPTDFERKVLDGYIASGLKTDDIIIADRLAQRGYDKFDSLISQKLSGKSWREIKEYYDVINMEEKLKVINIDDATVNEYMKKNNISDEEVVDAIVTSKNLDIDEYDAVKLKKEKKSKQEIYDKLLDKKFNQ